MSSVTCFDGSQCLVRRLVVSIAFSCSNSWLCSGSHWKAFSFPRSCLMAAVAWEKSGMKKESCWARPRNDLTPVRFVGCGEVLYCPDSVRVWLDSVLSHEVAGELYLSADLEFSFGQCNVHSFAVLCDRLHSCFEFWEGGCPD